MTAECVYNLNIIEQVKVLVVKLLLLSDANQSNPSYMTITNSYLSEPVDGVKEQSTEEILLSL